MKLKSKFSNILPWYNEKDNNIKSEQCVDVCKDFTVSFISFLRENCHTEFETWTKDVLPLDKVQNKKTYDIINIEDVLNKFLQEYEQ